MPLLREGRGLRRNTAIDLPFRTEKLEWCAEMQWWILQTLKMATKDIGVVMTGICGRSARNCQL